MDEQRLQEIEAWVAQELAYLCEIGCTQSSSPFARIKAVEALIAEVRRLRQDNATLTEIRQKGCDCADDDACRYARERDAALAKLEQVVAPLEVGGGREHYWKAQADAALAERDAADEALAACRSQGYSAIANLYALCQRMNRQKTAARRDEVMGHATRIASQAGIPTGVMAMLRDAVPTDAPTLVKEQDAAIAERDALRELLNVYNIGGWTDALAPMQRALKAEAALTEARRVLREVREVIDSECPQLREMQAVGLPVSSLGSRIVAVLAQEDGQ